MNPCLRMLIIVCALVSSVRAETRIVTFGGGNEPSHNEISLEKNILFFQQALSDAGMGQCKHDIHFADAGSSDRAVQFKLELTDQQGWMDFLSSLFGQGRVPATGYRRVELQQLAGASNLLTL